MNTNTILTEINGTMEALLQLISSIDESQINVIPFEGSWTAGQLAQHLVMSGTGFVQILNGPVTETDRPYDQAVEKIKSDFLDFSIKMRSPGYVVPPKKAYKKEELLHSLKDIQSAINLAIETMDLSKTCVAFGIPVFGFLTRFEAIHFVLYHTQRHIHSIGKHLSKVVNTN